MGTGAGDGLNFGGTNGSKEVTAPITSHGSVRYSKKKTEGYLLNPEHPQGAAKAKFMKEVLGYDKSDSHLFHKNVVSSIMGKAPVKTEQTKFGIKHTFKTKLISKNGSSVTANVVVVIQKDNGRITHKIVTVYPDKKGVTSMKELDVVRLKSDFQGLTAGTEGTIVLEYDGTAFEVEFFDKDGDTIDVITTPIDIIELVSENKSI